MNEFSIFLSVKHTNVLNKVTFILKLSISLYSPQKDSSATQNVGSKIYDKIDNTKIDRLLSITVYQRRQENLCHVFNFATICIIKSLGFHQNAQK